jgi:hypothetical protein
MPGRSLTELPGSSSRFGWSWGRSLANGRHRSAISPGIAACNTPRGWRMCFLDDVASNRSDLFVRKLSHARIRTTDFGDTHPATGHQ